MKNCLVKYTFSLPWRLNEEDGQVLEVCYSFIKSHPSSLCCKVALVYGGKVICSRIGLFEPTVDAAHAFALREYKRYLNKLVKKP